jgi:hypothetical protein
MFELQGGATGWIPKVLIEFEIPLHVAPDPAVLMGGAAPGPSPSSAAPLRSWHGGLHLPMVARIPAGWPFTPPRC